MIRSGKRRPALLDVFIQGIQEAGLFAQVVDNERRAADRFVILIGQIVLVHPLSDAERHINAKAT